MLFSSKTMMIFLLIVNYLLLIDHGRDLQNGVHVQWCGESAGGDYTSHEAAGQSLAAYSDSANCSRVRCVDGRGGAWSFQRHFQMHPEI